MKPPSDFMAWATMSSIRRCSYQMPLASNWARYSLKMWGWKNKLLITSAIQVCTYGWERQSVHVFAWIRKSLLLVDLLKDVFEATIVLLQDGVLGAQVQRPAFGQTHLEWAVGEVPDGLICIVHPHGNTTCAWTDTCRLCKPFICMFYCLFSILICSIAWPTTSITMFLLNWDKHWERKKSLLPSHYSTFYNLFQCLALSDKTTGCE